MVDIYAGFLTLSLRFYVRFIGAMFFQGFGMFKPLTPATWAKVLTKNLIDLTLEFREVWSSFIGIYRPFNHWKTGDTVDTWWLVESFIVDEYTARYAKVWICWLLLSNIHRCVFQAITFNHFPADVRDLIHTCIYKNTVHRSMCVSSIIYSIPFC